MQRRDTTSLVRSDRPGPTAFPRRAWAFAGLALATSAACAEAPPNPDVPRLDEPEPRPVQASAPTSTSLPNRTETSAAVPPRSTATVTTAPLDAGSLAVPTVTSVVDVPPKDATTTVFVTLPSTRTQPRYAPCDKPTCLCPRPLAATETPYAYVELRNPNPEPVHAKLEANSGSAEMPLVIAHFGTARIPERESREACMGSVTFGVAPMTVTSSDTIDIPGSKSVAVLVQSQFPKESPGKLTLTIKRVE
ncbi:MAG: hypothetical protein U0169_20250 [Polyangiaceae bacterium]